jgi:hypothetical protein
MMKALIVAESIVDKLGDANWFTEHYTMCREYFSIRTSVEMALEQQGLINIFNREMNPETSTDIIDPTINAWFA